MERKIEFAFIMFVAFISLAAATEFSTDKSPTVKITLNGVLPYDTTFSDADEVLNYYIEDDNLVVNTAIYRHCGKIKDQRVSFAPKYLGDKVFEITYSLEFEEGLSCAEVVIYENVTFEISGFSGVPNEVRLERVYPNAHDTKDNDTIHPIDDGGLITPLEFNQLYYFYSEYCSHCEDLYLELTELKKMGIFEGVNLEQISIWGKTSDDSELMNKYDIRAVPTLIGISREKICRMTGYSEKGELFTWLRNPTDCETLNYSYGDLIIDDGDYRENSSISEPGNTSVSQDNNTDIKPFYPNTCLNENKSFPFGYRVNGTYCSPENNTFIPQTEGGEYCDNNFECSTNLCADSQCIESGLIKKILSWFSRLF